MEGYFGYSVPSGSGVLTSKDSQHRGERVVCVLLSARTRSSYVPLMTTMRAMKVLEISVWLTTGITSLYQPRYAMSIGRSMITPSNRVILATNCPEMFRLFGFDRWKIMILMSPYPCCPTHSLTRSLTLYIFLNCV
jgi:hypothetical protein